MKINPFSGAGLVKDGIKEIELHNNPGIRFRKPGLCPKCGVAWPILREMMLEPKGTENRALAEVIMINCDVCRKEIEGGKENEKADSQQSEV